MANRLVEQRMYHHDVKNKVMNYQGISALSRDTSKKSLADANKISFIQPSKIML